MERNSKFVVSLCVFYAILIMLVKTAGAETKFLGNYKSHEIKDNAVIFNLGGPKVKIEFCTDKIVKVWMEPSGKFAASNSFVLEEKVWPKVELRVSDKGKYIQLVSTKLIIKVNKKPFRISYYDVLSNRLIAGERNGGGLGYENNRIYEYFALDKNEHFYGLGLDRDSGKLDRRGQRVSMLNDALKELEDACPGDVSGTFFTSTRGYGIYFDNTYINTTFDMGSESDKYYYFTAPKGEMIYYFISGSDLPDVMKNFAFISGKAPLPPKWALGYIQSKYGYNDWNEVKDIANTFRAKRIPVDGIILDVYWSPEDHYFDFSWSDDFSDPKTNLAQLASQGIKITPIVDPFVMKIANNFSDGDKNGYFAKNSAGKTTIYPAWYGDSGLVDFTNADARRWYAGQAKKLFDEGIRGWWLDLNEPENPTNHTGDYFSAGTADKVRNVYALNEAKAFYEGQRSYTDQRVWILSRSGFSGIQKYGATIWSGDIASTWTALTHSLEMGQSCGFSGIPYYTNDAGGFFGEPSPELYIRWMQATAYMPVFRAHGRFSPREPWVFGDEAEKIVTQVIRERYQMLPYIYSAARETALTNVPLMCGLAMYYPGDKNVYKIQDEWLFGKSLLVAPIHEEGATQREVYLPKGNWYDWRSNKRFVGNKTYAIDAPIDVLPVFAREGSIIPLGKVKNYVDEGIDDYIKLKIYPSLKGDLVKYNLYEDDGTTYAYETENYAVTGISVQKNKSGITLTIDPIDGRYNGMVSKRIWAADIKIDSSQIIKSVSRNGKPLKQVELAQEVDNGIDNFYYDSNQGILYLKTSEVSTGEKQTVEIF